MNSVEMMILYYLTIFSFFFWVWYRVLRMMNYLGQSEWTAFSLNIIPWEKLSSWFWLFRVCALCVLKFLPTGKSRIFSMHQPFIFSSSLRHKILQLVSVNFPSFLSIDCRIASFYFSCNESEVEKYFTANTVEILLH